VTRKKTGLLLLVLALLIAFFAFDLGQYLSLEYLKARQIELEAYFEAHRVRTLLIFFVIYVVVTGVSLPGAAIMTLAGGAILGLFWGTVLVSFASAVGATVAFLIARFLLRDIVQARFGNRLQAINAGIKKEGAFYLFTLRLVPLFPFFVINLLMALTPMRAKTFYWISQAGMLPATIVYVNAGTQLARIDSLSDLLSPAVLISFALLGLFPLITKKTVDFIQARKALQPYPKPAHFDRNLVVIGGGSAGLVSAYIAAAVKAEVTLIERSKMGGDCLNTGCVPSKALIRSARFLAGLRQAEALGFKSAAAEFDFAEIMERVQRVVASVEPHDSIERYTKLGVECLQGEAVITSPYSVQIGAKTLTTRNIIIAAGARPLVPPIPGIEQMDYLTSDTVWNLRECPKRLLVLGGGPIGCELSQCFARFGSRVTIVEMMPRLLLQEDPDISERVAQRFRQEGIDLRLGHKAKAFGSQNGQKTIICEHEGQEVRLDFDTLLLALGRKATVTGYGLEELGITLASNGTLEVNEFMQTALPNIYACGDVAGPHQFTHTAAHQAWYATVNALFGDFKKFRVDDSAIPWATFTDPEVARVGLNEQDAKARGIPYEVTTFELNELDRAIADEATEGVVKVLTNPGSDKILGAAVVGEHAGDLISEYVTAMRHGLGMNKILKTIHIYPTLAEANKQAAGQWKRAHAPKGVLRWMERFHAWRR
jgi:dihydrolipoamide dehydrogenase